MHEAMVARSLLEAISEEAAKHDGKPVGAKISCGKLSAVNDEALHFAFEVLAKDSVCEGMKLEIEHKPLLAQCRNCRQSFSVELLEPRCSACGSEDFCLLPDAALTLEEIEFQMD